MAKSQRDPNLESFWRQVLERRRASGLTVRAFCQQQRLTETSFHFWRRTIRKRDAAGQRTPASTPAFLPAVVQTDPSPASQADSCIAIDLQGGRVLRLPAAMPIVRVAELIRAIEGDVAASPAEVAS